MHVHAIPVPPCQYARGSRNDAKELLDGEKHVDATGSADACTMMNSFMSDLGMGPGELCKDQRRTAYAKTLERYKLCLLGPGSSLTWLEADVRPSEDFT